MKILEKQSVAAERPAFPFTALVGQDEMKLALLLNAIDSSVGGVLIMGHRGTGKSTAVRALANLLPPIQRARDCLYGCDPQDQPALCTGCRERLQASGKLARVSAIVPVVDLPLGATEDRVCGTISIERALTQGIKTFEPGLLARAHRGFLYIDEVNLLEDHLIDLLLDVAVTGRNSVEREGISIEHPARFVLIGSGNPEEGELRPQLLDRFGLHVEVTTETDLDRRVQIILAREAFERDPANFIASVEAEQTALRRKITSARKALHRVNISLQLLRRIAQLCLELKIDGHRGELTITRAARALAALEGRRAVNEQDVRRVAVMSLRHRLRRDPLEQTNGGARVEQALEQLFPHPQPDNDDAPPQNSHGGQDQNGPPHKTPTPNTTNDARTDQHATQSADEQRRAPTALDARLPDVGPPPPSSNTPQSRTNKKLSSHGPRGKASRTIYHSLRGRYTRAVVANTGGARIALDATLRASTGKVSGSKIEASDLRFKLFKRKVGTLYIFAIDTSGSMALNRIGQAKGALANLLRQSYIRRDRVSLVCFRGQQAETLLPPSASVTRAARILDELYIGGPTPLAAGISRALEIATRARQQGGASRIMLLLFTDGHANVTLGGESARAGTSRARVIWRELEQLGAEAQRAGIASIVVDTHNRFTGGGEGQRLADKLGGRHIYLTSNSTAVDELDALGDEMKNAL
jgi:magnesium chelatase subunit D